MVVTTPRHHLHHHLDHDLLRRAVQFLVDHSTQVIVATVVTSVDTMRTTVTSIPLDPDETDLTLDLARALVTDAGVQVVVPAAVAPGIVVAAAVVLESVVLVTDQTDKSLSLEIRRTEGGKRGEERRAVNVEHSRTVFYDVVLLTLLTSVI